MRFWFAATVASVLLPSVAQAADRPLPLMPMPASVVEEAGHFAFSAATPVVAEDKGARAAAERFIDLLARSGGPRLTLAGGQSPGPAIRFQRDASISGKEAYRLEVLPGGITIRASDDAGLFYGATTLWQLAESAPSAGQIDAVRIADAPRFGWRGLMLDSVRHFQPVDYIKQLIDRMAMAKLNIFHWHLTDDQGWRIEIKRYPRLTEVGAWRMPPGAGGVDPKTGKPVRIGGFYTQDEVRDVVAYAAARHITVLPEIEMPGHATAAIAAYPELASTPYAPIAPSSDWGILPNLFYPGEKSFTFLENVLDEVMQLFPGRFIHVGGDEAVKDQWKANPAIQAKIKELGLADENALQGWFTAKIGTYLEAHGRHLIGWDEILEGGVPKQATVMSWRGIDGAIAAAKAGHDTVLAPSPILYFDNRQSASPDEPPGRGEIIDLQRLYAFDPVPDGLTPEQRDHILGLQATLFTEHTRTPALTDRMIWPRASALAELGWSSAASHDWTSFARRLPAQLARDKDMGLAYNSVPLEPQASFAVAAKGGGIAVTLKEPAGIGTVRYTLDGSAPAAGSPAYAGPITVRSGTRVSAASFADGRALTPPKSWTVTADSPFTKLGGAMELCANKLPLREEDDHLDNDTAHWVDVMEPCWIWRAVPLDKVTGFTAEFSDLPYNFALAGGEKNIVLATPSTPGGEIEIRQDSCTGPRLAAVPIVPGTRRVAGPLTGRDTHDLCVVFTQSQPAPLRTLDRMTLDHGNNK